MAAVQFFWHDYETFGRVPRRDRPAQFAGLRTDAELEEIGTPLVLYCQPPTDRLPDPEACLLTGITPQHCAMHGCAEHEFAARIHAALAEPETIGAGYNSIRFDDEVTRHLFWRNLIDPYGREWQNGCGRWDLLDAMRCACALRPDGIEWPLDEGGRVSFKLERLTQANALAHGSAHDALSDVKATVALARLLRTRQPRLFDFCLKLRHKDEVWKEIGPEPRPFLHISGRLPAERGCLALVWPLAPHPVNRNELIVWDLAQDPEELVALGADEVRARLFVRDDELPAGRSRLPIKTIHVNRAPIVIGNRATLTDAMAERWRIDRAAWEAHAQTARRLRPAFEKLRASFWPAVYARPSAGVRGDADEDLYGGFVGGDDRRALDRMRTAGASRPTHPPRFVDPRLDELVQHWRARNFPATLAADEAAQWEAHRRRRLHDGAGGATTLAQFQDRIDALAETADERGLVILDALADWAEVIAC